jgi:hypothetical protein
MSWNVYSVGPIDHGWEHLKTVKETLADIASREDEIEETGDRNAEAVQQFIADWSSATAAAGSEGWEGDFRHEPRVFWLPSEVNFVYGFVFKQDNNGTTFVVSPQVLPAMEELA